MRRIEANGEGEDEEGGAASSGVSSGVLGGCIASKDGAVSSAGSSAGSSGDGGAPLPAGGKGSPPALGPLLPDVEGGAEEVEGAAAVAAMAIEEVDLDADVGELFIVTAKAMQVKSGCDGTNSEKIGVLKAGTPIRLLEKRLTEAAGMRAYVTSLPGDTVKITVALNEFNHSVQRFRSVAEYEAARANYLEDIVEREAIVEDAITGDGT